MNPAIFLAMAIGFHLKIEKFLFLFSLLEILFYELVPEFSAWLIFWHYYCLSVLIFDSMLGIERTITWLNKIKINYIKNLNCNCNFSSCIEFIVN